MLSDSVEEVGCFWVVLGCRWLRNERAEMLEVWWIWGMNFERFEGCWRSGLQWDEGGGNPDLLAVEESEFSILSG